MIKTDMDTLCRRDFFRIDCAGSICYIDLITVNNTYFIEYSFYNDYLLKWKKAKINLYAAFKCCCGNAPAGTPYGYFNIITPDKKKIRLQVTL